MHTWRIFSIILKNVSNVMKYFEKKNYSFISLQNNQIVSCLGKLKKNSLN